MHDFLLTDTDKALRAEMRELLRHELPPWTATIEDGWDAVVEVVRALGEAGYLGFMLSGLYRGPLEHSGFAHATMLRRGSLTELLRSGARSRTVEPAAEVRRRVGPRKAAPEDGGRAGDQQEASVR